MMTNPFESELLAMVRHLPRGRVTTYGELARALDPRLTGHDVAEWLLGSCQGTVLHLLGQNHNASDPVLPCWRILEDAPPERLSPIEGRTMETDDPMYRLLIQPLLEDGIPLEPPEYRIPPEYLYRWPELQEAARAEDLADDTAARDRLAFFRKQAEEAGDMVRAAANLTRHGPYAIGLRKEASVGFIYQMRVSPESVATDLECPGLWKEIRTVRLKRHVGDEDDEPSRVNEIDQHIFYLEEWLDDGRWHLWVPRSDGNWEIPAGLWDVMTEPTDPTREALLGQFERILEISARRIVFYQRPEQWNRSPAPETAWDPPEILTHAQLVRTAPFMIREVALDDTATLWTLTMESVHFPETVRRVIIPWAIDQRFESPFNLAAQLWRDLQMRCEAWFDLHYSTNIPEDQRVNAATYGGWHLQSDGSWLIKQRIAP